MTEKSNILELELDGVIVEKIKYWGRPHMIKMIEEYKNVYNLKEGDNYAFFYYKQVEDSEIMDEDAVINLGYWEQKHGKLA